MNFPYEAKGLLFGLIAMLAAIAVPLEAIAEKMDHTLTKSNGRTIFRSALAVGASNHEVGTELVRSDMKSSNPNFRIKEEWVYNQFDNTDGSGPHRGTFIDTHEDGSQAWGTYEGAQKTAANADGSWISTWEGRHRYTGGTGKLKNIKGGGTYKGRATSTGEYSEDSKESVEF